jgi:hypothetical protein
VRLNFLLFHYFFLRFTFEYIEEVGSALDHTITISTKFLEEKIICRYGVPKFIFIDNGGEWFVEFHKLCKVYSIHHQYIAS